VTEEEMDRIEATFLQHCADEPMAGEADRRQHLLDTGFTEEQADAFLAAYFVHGPAWREHLAPVALAEQPAQKAAGATSPRRGSQVKD
jgi:hypothetical protein